jgi:hypothetical protein
LQYWKTHYTALQWCFLCHSNKKFASKQLTAADTQLARVFWQLLVLLQVSGSSILQLHNKCLFISADTCKSGNPQIKSGLTNADLHLHVYQFGCKTLFQAQRKCCCLKTDPSVMKKLVMYDNQYTGSNSHFSFTSTWKTLTFQEIINGKVSSFQLPKEQQ